MSHPDATRTYEEDQQARWQAEDEEQKFMRAIELAQKAKYNLPFDERDMEDLIYHLGIKEYFK